MPKFIHPVFFMYIVLMMLSCNPTEPSEQMHDLRVISPLPGELSECSGLISLDKQTFAGLNDRGDKPIIYVFDLKKDSAVKKISIDNAENNDWEELTQDENFVYIGDTGNNGGTRQNLMIYKVRKADLLTLHSVVPEKIMFRYEGQTKFNDSNRHNFDCEAMVVVGDSLFLFSKNRGDLRTDVYGIPKIPGSYLARKIESFDAKGLITGADYRADQNGAQLILVGYDISDHIYSPYLIFFKGFTGSHFFNGTSQRIYLDRKLQTESVLFQGDQMVYISNEESKKDKGFIYAFSLPK